MCTVSCRRDAVLQAAKVNGLKTEVQGSQVAGLLAVSRSYDKGVGVHMRVTSSAASSSLLSDVPVKGRADVG